MADFTDLWQPKTLSLVATVNDKSNITYFKTACKMSATVVRLVDALLINLATFAADVWMTM